MTATSLCSIDGQMPPCTPSRRIRRRRTRCCSRRRMRTSSCHPRLTTPSKFGICETRRPPNSHWKDTTRAANRWLVLPTTSATPPPLLLLLLLLLFRNSPSARLEAYGVNECRYGSWKTSDARKHTRTHPSRAHAHTHTPPGCRYTYHVAHVRVSPSQA